jgi:hypothetical protein
MHCRPDATCSDYMETCKSNCDSAVQQHCFQRTGTHHFTLHKQKMTASQAARTSTITLTLNRTQPPHHFTVRHARTGPLRRVRVSCTDLHPPCSGTHMTTPFHHDVHHQSSLLTPPRWTPAFPSRRTPPTHTHTHTRTHTHAHHMRTRVCTLQVLPSTPQRVDRTSPSRCT